MQRIPTKIEGKKETEEETREEGKELTREVRNAITKKEIKIREAIPGKRTWWDRECRESKTKLNKLHREMRKGKVERNEYLEKKRKHAKLCKENQEEEKKKEQKKLLEIKDRNEILKYIKRERQQREYADEDIKEEE